MSKRHLEKDDLLATTLNGVHDICFPLFFGVYGSRTIISLSSKYWMICTELNDLYLRSRMYFNYVEWFVLTWRFCTCNVECVLTLLKELHCCWRFNEISSWKISPGKLPWNFLSHENPNNEHCLMRKPLLWKLLW